MGGHVRPRSEPAPFNGSTTSESQERQKAFYLHLKVCFFIHFFSNFAPPIFSLLFYSIQVVKENQRGRVWDLPFPLYPHQTGAAAAAICLLCLLNINIIITSDCPLLTVFFYFFCLPLIKCLSNLSFLPISKYTMLLPVPQSLPSICPRPA